MRAALAGLLALSGLASGAAAIHAVANSPTLALLEEISPEALGPEALRLRIEAAMARMVDAEWLARETEAALAAQPLNWARLDALSALSALGADRALGLPPETAARLAAAQARRPGWIAACAAGAFARELPDHPTAIGCHFGAALTLIGDGRDLLAEGAKRLNGEDVDAITVALAGAGFAAALAGPAAPAVKASAAALRTARKLGALRAGLVDDLAASLRRSDVASLRAELAGIGRVAARTDPVTAIRSLRHLHSLEDARRLRRVSEAMGPRTAHAFEALGARRVFATLTRVSRAALEIGALAASALALLLGALAALGQIGLGRLLRPARG